MTPAETALASAEAAYTAAVQAAVGNHGPWGDVRQAGEVVRQCRAALRVSEGAK